ncbi:MAG TPA: ATP-binding protein [Kofleriaceae bacterium]|nr:ATP-binding protein [Kofleriaceae bacterium]
MSTSDSVEARTDAATAAAMAARKLSQRATEAALRGVLAQAAAAPDRLAALLDAAEQPLIAFDAQRRLLAANAAAAAFFGYEPHELVGASADDLVPARLRQPDAPPMVAHDELTTVELPGLLRDGSERMLSWTFGAATPACFIMVVRDRTAIDDALDALHASEERFRLLVDGVRDHAIFLLDASGRIATWNVGAERIKGWRAEEIIGQAYETFVVERERATGVPSAQLAAAAAAGRLEVSGWRMRRDGTQFYAESAIWPLHARDGSLQGYAVITHDLTERRAAEENERRLAAERTEREAVERAHHRLQLVHRVAVTLSRTTTPEEVAVAVLDEALTGLGAVAGAVYALEPDGQTLRLLGERGHPIGATRPFETMTLDGGGALRDAARTGTALFFDDVDAAIARYPAMEPFIRAGGFEGSVALPLRVGGRVLGVAGIRYGERRVFDDGERSLMLTVGELCAQALERARLFAAERQARGDAEAASQAKDEFLAMLGHELRNPLAPISTAIQLMELRGDPESRRERAIIERQLGHITRLVDDLLDVSRITRGKLELSRQPVDLAEVVARAVEMASPLLEQRGHHVRIEVPRGLWVAGDAARLAQVLSNLVTNAARYTPRSGHIEVEGHHDGATNVVSVRDDGEGIDAALLPRVFELFVQGKRALDRASGGLGIGLALVKSLVALHGGTVSARSAGPGAGSTFEVRLPALDHVPVAAAERSAPALPSGRKRVLVVDDNADAAELLAAALTDRGYDVAWAIDAPTALERLDHHRADVAVLDLGLPVVDGFELARQIRERFADRVPRLVALTGYG